MAGGFASWVSQLLGGESGYVQGDWADAEPEVEAEPEWPVPTWTTSAPVAVAPPVAAPRALIGPATGRSAAVMLAMTGPGLCTPRC